MKNLCLLVVLAGMIFVPLGNALADDVTGMGEIGVFSTEGEDFLLNGKPIQLISGEMHYPRIPREYWRDRMLKAKAMGINSICTYIFWNMHEPTPGVWDFQGNLDVAEFVKLAQELGLWVIIRPGPYVCTEWDFGGFPGWLLKDPQTVVRSQDKFFLERSARYMKKVGQELADLQITKGGPIIMVQVENEYGSYGKDHVYMKAIKDQITDAGFDVPLFTSDGPGDYMLKGGTLDDVVSVVNFGGNAKGAFKKHREFREVSPRMCGEFWVGWFDHWGKPHHSTGAKSKADNLKWMLENNISVNIYMFHGGTNWAFMAGANS